MKYIIVIVILSCNLSGYAQETSRPLSKRIIVKTNVLSLVAQRPTLSVEKVFSNTFSTEVSFVQGQFNNFLLTDHYDYNGFLIRAKKYFKEIDAGKISSYGALYGGSLNRTIKTEGWVDNSGFFGYPSRDFSASSVRGGGSLGISYISKSRIIIDSQVSLGYGRYTHYYTPDNDSKGYVDTQVWLSFGYCF